MAKFPEHPDELKMSLGEHLEELRRRVIYSLLAIALAVLACIFFARPLVRFIVTPVYDAVYDIQQGAGQGDAGGESPGAAPAGERPREPLLVVLSPMEGFITGMKAALVAALIISSPVVLYQLWLFVAAGLYPHERKVVHLFVPFSAVLFLAGTVFAYKIVLRFGLPLLINFFGFATDMARPMISLSIAINFVLMMSVVMGAVFQLPLVMMALAKVGLVKPETFLKQWRYAIVAIFILSAVLTPPDVVTQLAMAGPMIALYWLGVFLAKAAVRRR